MIPARFQARAPPLTNLRNACDLPHCALQGTAEPAGQPRFGDCRPAFDEAAATLLPGRRFYVAVQPRRCVACARRRVRTGVGRSGGPCVRCCVHGGQLWLRPPRIVGQHRIGNRTGQHLPHSDALILALAVMVMAARQGQQACEAQGTRGQIVDRHVRISVGLPLPQGVSSVERKSPRRASSALSQASALTVRPS